ncbi:MAG: hypothetical protein KUG78_08605 [Kangiellaceae bacterium]|nr:hypothetical protein [Kangiellaceae bacterium]
MSVTRLCIRSLNLNLVRSIGAVFIASLKKQFLIILFFIFAINFAKAANEKQNIDLVLGGGGSSFKYTSELLTRALRTEGYVTKITYAGSFPTNRLEQMLQSGEINAHVLGKTTIRSSKLLLVDVAMTSNLFGNRILFIRRGTQHEYDNVYTLEDFQKLGKTVGMGVKWSEVPIWIQNQLPVQTIDGNWRRLYSMIASGKRNVDYLTRAPQEAVEDHVSQPELIVESNLVLLYKHDHVLYVSPKNPALHKILLDALIKAKESGLIQEVAKEFYPEVYLPPISLDKRRVIHLQLPD